MFAVRIRRQVRQVHNIIGRSLLCEFTGFLSKPDYYIIYTHFFIIVQLGKERWWWLRRPRALAVIIMAQPHEAASVGWQACRTALQRLLRRDQPPSVHCMAIGGVEIGEV